ncbi:MAG: quinate 5-dehydrogenase [bacterium]
MELNCVSISLGSSARNKSISFEVSKVRVNVCRFGVNGDFLVFAKLVESLQDGSVDSIGFGGIDLVLFLGDKFFFVKDAYKVYSKSTKVPIVDGSITKRILEKMVVQKLIDDGVISYTDRVFLVSCLDRFEILRVLIQNKIRFLIGDLVFSLGVNKVLESVEDLESIAYVLLKDVLNLPFEFIYPVGSKQNREDLKICDIVSNYDFDVIVGDFHYIRKVLRLLKGKLVVTNTVTLEDIEDMKSVGVRGVISMGICLSNRSFGANVLDCIFAAYCNKIKGVKISPFDFRFEDYLEFVRDFLGIKDFAGNRIV